MNIVTIDSTSDKEKLIQFCHEATVDTTMPASVNMSVVDWENSPNTLLHAIFIQKRFDSDNSAAYYMLEEDGKYVAGSGCYPLDSNSLIYLIACRGYTLPKYRGRAHHGFHLLPKQVELAKQNGAHTVMLTFNEYNLRMRDTLEKITSRKRWLGLKMPEIYQGEWHSLEFPITVQYIKQWGVYKHLDTSYKENFNRTMEDIKYNIPLFAPLNYKFDQQKLLEEIEESGILNDLKVATTHKVEEKGFWDNKVNFTDPKFDKLKQIPYWDGEGPGKKLVSHAINTFYQVNLTTPNKDENDLSDSWVGEHQAKTKTPLWVALDHPWFFRTDCELPYLKSIVKSLGLEYASMIRIVYQKPPSIGLIHKDSGPKTNAAYYDNGGVTITLNVTGGGANLYFVDSAGKERKVDEDNLTAWHFDDSALHCTDEVTSERLQIRIYGKHKNYKDLMLLDKGIY